MFTSASKLFQIVAVFFVLIGCGLLAGGFWSYRSTQNFLRTARPATGHVIGYERHTDNEGAISYYPVITFTPPGESEIEFTSSTGSNNRSYRIGAEVPLLYDPALPFNAAIDNPASKWLVTGILGFMGVVFMVVGAAGFWFFRPSGEVGRMEATQIDTSSLDDTDWDDMDEDDQDDTPTNNGLPETVKVI